MRRMKYTGRKEGKRGGVKVDVLVALADSFGMCFEIDAGWGRGRGGMEVEDQGSK